MKLYQVSLNSIDAVKSFVELTTLLNDEVDVLSGRYVVDGKSIMGLFSIDLSRPVTVRLHGDEEEAERFHTEAAKFLTIAEIKK